MTTRGLRVVAGKSELWGAGLLALSLVAPTGCKGDAEPLNEREVGGKRNLGGASGSGGRTTKGGRAGQGSGGTTSGDAGRADAGEPGAGGSSRAGSSSGGRGGAKPRGGSGGKAEAGEAGDANDGGSAPCGPDDPSCVSACSVEILSAEIAPGMKTVGVIEFSTSLELGAIDRAVIQFGLDEKYGFEAPVDLGEPTYRTLLLGMKPNTTYHYRVRVKSGSATCDGGKGTLQTGTLPSGTPANAQITVTKPEDVESGFIVTSSYGGDYAYILDADGVVVWASLVASSDAVGLGRARLSRDSKSLYVRELNVPSAINQGKIFKIATDGSGTEEILLSTSHHDFLLTANDDIVYLSKVGSDMGCDAIRKRSADGESDDLVFDLWDALSEFEQYSSTGGDLCHANALRYDPSDDTYTVSETDRNVFVKVTTDGELVWTLGGSDGSFSGDVTWNREYGHQMLGSNRILFFNNGNTSGADPGNAIELALDTGAHTATEVWRYTSSLASQVMGDVQRLSQGNTLVTYSVASTIHEVDPDQQLVRSLKLAGTCGYTTQRPSLYGPSPN